MSANDARGFGVSGGLAGRVGPRQALLLFLVVVLLIPGSVAMTAPQAQTVPTISIVSVEAGESVTVRTHNFPADRTFTARMGPMGTRGINGTVVGETDSGDGGSFDVTYDIPDGLANAALIALRLESSGGYYAYNWFYNSTAAGDTDNGDADNGDADNGDDGDTEDGDTATIPTFTITSVTRDDEVTILTKNFPANVAFTVRMGEMGTRGEGGIVVATTDSMDGGEFSATYSIPEELQGEALIAIRLDGDGGYYSYNWFYNYTTP